MGDAPGMGESRSDLLAWLNSLLQLNLTKIESLGSGAAYCQVLDSIYGDLPMHKVKFQANSEYQYVANFKVLQDSFTRHKIDKPVPVIGLVKCKMQDNLEFCQWLKRFWDAKWPGIEYDAVGRRGGQGAERRGMTPSSTGSGSSRAPPAARTSATTTEARRTPAASTSTSTATRRPLGGSGSRVGAGSANNGVSNETIQILTNQMSEMKVSVEALEKERDFYFGKLREIEIIVAARLEEPDETPEAEILKKVQDILYQTEEGFEVPNEEEGALVDEEEE